MVWRSTSAPPLLGLPRGRRAHRGGLEGGRQRHRADARDGGRRPAQLPRPAGTRIRIRGRRQGSGAGQRRSRCRADAARGPRREGRGHEGHMGPWRSHGRRAVLRDGRGRGDLGHRRRLTGHTRHRGCGGAGRGRRDRLRAEPHARRGRRAMAGGAGGGRDLHGLRDRRVPWVRGAAQTRRIRPRVQGRPGLSRRRHRLGRAAVASHLRGGRMSTDMSVAVGGMKLRGPVLAASGTFGYGTEVRLAGRRAVGARVSKGIFLRPREGTAPPRIAETPSGMLNAIGLQGPGADALVRDYAPQWAEWDFPVLVNINGESASEYAELTSRLDGVPGVAGFAINISCPNVEQGGMFFGNDPRAAATVTEAVRKRTKLPVWVKLTPMVSDIGVIARAVEPAGADALCAINTFVGMSIDLNAYRPRLSFRTGGLSGPAIRPLAVHLAHQAARAVRIPVIGIGGGPRGEDAPGVLGAGWPPVQGGPATFVNPKAIADVHDGIAAFLEAKGFSSLAHLPRYLPLD